MGHTNTTPNYNLPQFLGSDKPAWLTDVNNAMSAIDSAIAAAKAAADNAGGAAAALATTVGGHTTQLETLSGTVANQGASIVSQGNSINTISELIGNGTPTTTDHTLIGAINELNAKEGDLADLQTTDKSSLVAAINEAAQSGGGGGGSSTTGQITAASGVTLSSNYVVKQGDTVYFHGTAVLATEGPIANMIVGALPSGYIPGNAVTTGSIIGVNATGFRDAGRLVVGTDGNITVQGILSQSCTQAVFNGYFKI